MNNTLEQTVLFASILGHLTPDQVKPHLSMFSKNGKVVYQGLAWLIKKGQTPPFAPASVKLACAEAFGGDLPELDSYFKEMQTNATGPEIEVVLRGASDKLRLLDIHNAVVKQMADMSYEPDVFSQIIDTSTSIHMMKSLAEEASDWEADDGTTRIALGDELMAIDQEARGVAGFWVIGGITGSGKSTLAWQISLTAARQRPVLYYDLENTARVLYERTLAIYAGDAGETDKALRSIFVRTEPREVFREVRELGEPSLVVLDSLQKLPADVHYKRETMEEWLAKLDRLKMQGHIVIVVSQLNRSSGDYKGTNDIEHTADFGIKLDPHNINPLWSNVYIEKNRHGIAKGFLCSLQRERSWLWRQVV